MNNDILYDFKAALAKIIESHSDMKLVISKWREMLDSAPKDVEFVFADGDRVVVPNIEKIAETINERTLPPNPTFDSVKAVSRNGGATLAAGGLSFSGARVGATYDAYGTKGNMYAIDRDQTLTLWPIPRYWTLPNSGAAHVLISPQNIKNGIPEMADFFVVVPDTDRSIEITLQSYTRENTQTLTLNCPIGEAPAIWHVAVYATRQTPGTVVRGSATLMGKGV